MELGEKEEENILKVKLSTSNNDDKPAENEDHHYYEVNGVKYNEKELELLTYLSKQHIKFNVPRFLLLTFYHFLSIVFSFMIANPIVFVFELFSSKLLFNILFIAMDPEYMMNLMQ